MKRTASICTSFLCIIFLIYGCKPAAQSKSNIPATLTFGQGGGFTGRYTEYSLIIDGSLYSNDVKTGERTFKKDIGKKDCRALFAEAESLGLLKMDFNQPVNMNFYIVYRKGTVEKKVNWGDARNPPPEGVKELWDKLWALTK